MKRLEATLHRTRAQRRERATRSANSLEVPGPELLQFEQIAEKSSGGIPNHHHVRLGKSLQLHSEIRSFADNAMLLCLSRPSQVANNDEAGRNADTGLERGSHLEPSHRIDQSQPGTHRQLSV